MDVTNNSNEFWSWASERNLITPIVTAQRLVLEEQDALCKMCMVQDVNTMLCSGTRTVFSIEESEYRSCPMLRAGQCSKANREQENLDRSDIWSRTFLWPNTLEHYLLDFAKPKQDNFLHAKIECSGAMWTINGEAPPTLSRLEPVMAQSKAAQELVFAHAKAGVVASYINVLDFFYVHSEKDRPEFLASNKDLPHFYDRGNSLTANLTRLSGAKWVVLTGFPKMTGRTINAGDTILSYVLDRIAPVVEYRIERNLPITVALTESEVPYVSDKLKPLVREIASWNPLF